MAELAAGDGYGEVVAALGAELGQLRLRGGRRRRSGVGDSRVEILRWVALDAEGAGDVICAPFIAPMLAHRAGAGRKGATLPATGQRRGDIEQVDGFSRRSNDDGLPDHFRLPTENSATQNCEQPCAARIREFYCFV